MTDKPNNSLPQNPRDYTLFLADAKGRVSNWNDGAEHILKYTGSQIIGIDLPTLFPNEDVKEKIASFVNSAEEVRLEFVTQCVRKDGSILPALVNITRAPVEPKEGNRLLVFIRDLTEREMVDERLRESEVQLRALSNRLLAAHEEERTRIARELHEEFGETLPQLRVDLTALEKIISRDIGEPLAKISIFEKIGGISELLEKAIRSTRRLITELRPAVLDELGLQTAIQWQALEFENRTGIKCEFRKMGREAPLDTNISTSIFRVLQEALSNVARHSNASAVRISLRFVDDNVILEVHDNGKGMQEGKQKDPASTGILSIRERVLVLGGEFEILGKRGEGTTLKVSIPYRSIGERMTTEAK